MDSNNKKRLFSVLMANYNNSGYISQAIDSVVSQTYNNWELVIVDDASSDNSVEIVKGYLWHKRIKLFRNSRNLGCGAAKKRCAELATGEILGILDPDDVLDKNVLDVIMNAYQSDSEYGFVYSTHYECDKNLKSLRISPWVGSISPGKTNLNKSKISAFRSFKKSVYKKTEGYDPFFRRAADKDIIYKLEELTRIKYINKPLYYYRIYNGGISQGENTYEARCYDILAKCNAYLRRRGTKIPNITREDISKSLFSETEHCLATGKIKWAFIFLFKAVGIRFFSIKNFLIFIFKLLFYFPKKVIKIY